jgi:hypothetical protein
MMAKVRALANLICFTLSLSLLTALPASGADLRVIDIAQVTWNGAKSPSVNPQEIIKSIEESVAPNWKSFTSTKAGSKEDKSITFQYGKTLNTPVRLSAPMNCSGDNFALFINSVRSQVYKELGVGEEGRYLIILSPDAGCIWSGRALMGSFASKGGSMVLHNTASAFVITHELGHNLGLGHSNLLRCSNGASDGPWSSTCRGIEYGGTVDVMGNVETDGPLSIYHQWRLGLINNAEVRQSWVSENIELSAINAPSGLKGIFLRDGQATYWVEYRRPSSNQSFNPGLVIYRSDPPPFQFIDTPLTDEVIVGSPGLGITTDMWMLNLDTYNYSQSGRATGSMTLAASKSATLFTGNITLSLTATTDSDKVMVAITRKSDTSPPPTPVVKDPRRWGSPDAEILESGFEDRESAIAEFQLKIAGQGEQILNTGSDGTVATYLDPFNNRKALRVKDLPEGDFEFSIRSKDIWGNLSTWSNPVKALIDRSYPLVGREIAVTEFSKDRLGIGLTSFSDKGSGLCQTAIVNEDGWVLQATQESQRPSLNMALNSLISARFETFDCLGNGVTGSLKLSNQVRSALDAKRTGKWSNISNAGVAGLRCKGKCTISLTVRDNVALISGEGSADILLTGKVVQKISASSNQGPRVSANLSLGSSSKVMRVSGRDFTIYGFIQSRVEISGEENLSRRASIEDPSLGELIQSRLARFGFRQGDFSNPWVIQPMERGTTLLDPSLDLCSATYKSESGRQYRRQVIASKMGSPYIFLSSEVVKYVDKSAADSALAELKTNYEACLKNKGGSESDGTFTDYTFTPLPISDAALLPEGSRVLVRAQIGKGASARQLLAFYQFREELFTGLYIVKAGEIGYSDSETKRWFEVAAVMAERLKSSSIKA